MEESASYLPGAMSSGSSVPELLANLPSRGLLSSTVISPAQGRMRVYVCDKDTSPPDDQYITTNQQNILIRSLTLRKQKGDSGADGFRKRAAEKTIDVTASNKRPNGQFNSWQGGMSSQASPGDFQGLTVERLRALLKAKGLSPKGKKDELIARLKGANDYEDPRDFIIFAVDTKYTRSFVSEVSFRSLGIYPQADILEELTSKDLMKSVKKLTSLELVDVISISR